MTRPRPLRESKPTKALFAGGTAVLGSLITAAADSHLTLTECLIAALAGLVAMNTVYIVPNEPKK